MGACEKIVFEDDDFSQEIITADDGGEQPVFFAPVNHDLVDTLIAQFNAEKARIEEVAALFGVGGELLSVVNHFIEGNRRDRDSYFDLSRVFELEGAMLSLTASYWSKALALTDVMEFMPQARRDEWYTQLRSWKEYGYKKGKNPEKDMPDFTENVVRPTLMSLLNSRAQFLAEKVDGVFKELSGEHVTNCPEAFGKRMIISRIHDGFSTNHSRCGYIADLRAVIAKFMGREGQPSQWETSQIVSRCMKTPGVWHWLDGGALRLRVYKVGTAHLEVCEEMSWRLNGILASIYPNAIPPKFRRKPAKKSKTFAPLNQPLPFAVVNELHEVKRVSGNLKMVEMRYRSPDERGEAYKAARVVLESLGGTVADNRIGNTYVFDYDPWDAINEVRISGCVPDDKSHQYYPTPESVGVRAVDMADIGDEDTVLEPSAGQGALAELLPKDRTTCIELSALRCKVLEAKGFNTYCGDFIEWADNTGMRFDRVVMNPPFADGRAIMHTRSAGSLVKHGGVLVAVLPGSARNKELLPGWTHEWSELIDNAFDGTSVSVVILKATRK